MFHGFSEKVISFAAKNKYISQEEFEEYTYGFELILSILLTDITVLLIGLLMNMLVESIVFWVVYKILRKYTGGFHFDLLSILVYHGPYRIVDHKVLSL